MAEGGVTRGPQIQYQDYATEPYPPFANVSGATATQPTQVLPGRTTQYQDIAEPLAVPTVGPPVEPTGVAAWAANYPIYRLRRAMLPETGGIFAPTYTPQVSGSALSWVPVYHGKIGLPAFQQQDHTDPSLWIVPNTSAAPTGVAVWAAQYPSRVGRHPNQYPNVGPSLTWVPQEITPPPAPVQHRFQDLRRRQQLLIRRLLS
jgi:hypothetical protein